MTFTFLKFIIKGRRILLGIGQFCLYCRIRSAFRKNFYRKSDFLCRFRSTKFRKEEISDSHTRRYHAEWTRKRLRLTSDSCGQPTKKRNIPIAPSPKCNSYCPHCRRHVTWKMSRINVPLKSTGPILWRGTHDSKIGHGYFTME